VREFGTLKALGWRSRRITGQVLGESVVICIAGGLAGIGLGFAGAAVVSALSPPLTAAVGPSTGSATPGGAQVIAGGPPGGGAGGGPGAGLRRLFGDATSAVTVHLSATVTVGAVLLAVLLAIAGGLLAGSLGGWQAARLRPADAMARAE